MLFAFVVNVPNLLRLWGAGQANLLKSSILVVGAGGLGASALLYFAAAGVGKYHSVIYHPCSSLYNFKAYFLKSTLRALGYC